MLPCFSCGPSIPHLLKSHCSNNPNVRDSYAREQQHGKMRARNDYIRTQNTRDDGRTLASLEVIDTRHGITRFGILFYNFNYARNLLLFRCCRRRRLLGHTQRCGEDTADGTSGPHHHCSEITRLFARQALLRCRIHPSTCPLPSHLPSPDKDLSPNVVFFFFSSARGVCEFGQGRMRPLSEDETKIFFEKLTTYIGRNVKHLIDRPDEEYCFRLHKERVYYLSQALARFAPDSRLSKKFDGRFY